MRVLVKILMLCLFAGIGVAQSPQISVAGNIGAGGVFPLINSPSVIFTSDANHTMAFPEMSGTGGFIQVTSSVSLTATRRLVAPLTKGFGWTIENATTGGQSITVIATTGAGVTIPNGQSLSVWNDGTNYVLSGSAGSSGVNQIVAGTNVTISPGGGTGVVTINASASSSLTNNFLQTDVGTSNFLSNGPSEGLIINGGYPQKLATLLGIPSANWHINSLGSGSLPDMISCIGAGGAPCTGGGAPGTVGNIQNGTWPIAFPLGVTNLSKVLIFGGFNDVSVWGGSPSAAQLDYYRGDLLAWGILFGIPDAQKLTAAASCTTTGTWTAGAAGFPSGTIQSTVPGSTLTCTGQNATDAGFIVVKSVGFTSTFTATVNGSPIVDPVTKSSTINTTASYTGSLGGQSGFYAVGQNGLPGGLATLSLTVGTAGAGNQLIVVAPYDLNALNNIANSPPVLIGLAPFQCNNGNSGANCTSPAANHSDAQILQVRVPEISVANELRSNGLNVSYFDMNATDNGSNSNNVTDTGATKQFTVTAGGTGFTSDSPIITFTGSNCTIEPTAMATNVSVSGGAIVTGTYYVTTSGQCTGVPTITITGGTGAAATAIYAQDFIHPNEFGGTLVGALAAGEYNSASRLADKLLPIASESFAPLVNPSGGQNNYAPLNGPSFTGGVNSSDVGPAYVGTTTDFRTSPIQAFNTGTGLSGSPFVVGPVFAAPNLAIGQMAFTYVSMDPSATGNDFFVTGVVKSGTTGSTLNYGYLGMTGFSVGTGIPQPGLVVCVDGSIGSGVAPGSTCPQTGGGYSGPSVTDAGLTSGNCLQASTGGKIVDTGSPCGSGGGGITALTGDGTASGSGSVAFTLATVSSTFGTCGDATHVCQITTNAKGLTASQSAVAITAGSSTIFQQNGTGLTSSTTVNFKNGTGNGGIAITNPTAGELDFNLSLPIAGAGLGFTTGPTSGVTPGDIAVFTGTAGQVTDGALAESAIVTLTGTQTLTNKTLTSPTLTTPALGTPASGILTNTTGLPISTGVSGLGTGIATFLATPTSADLAAAVTDETGSGALVFGTSPTFITPALGTPASGVVTNLTGTGAFNTTGTAANLSGTPALPNGTTATTQTVGDNTTKLATDAFVLANAGGTPAFSVLTSGTNTAATMVLGTGSSLTVSGTGTNNATTLLSNTWAAPGTIGGTTPGAGNFTTGSFAGQLTALALGTAVSGTNFGSNTVAVQGSHFNVSAVTDTFGCAITEGTGTNPTVTDTCGITTASTGVTQVIIGSPNGLVSTAGVKLQANGRSFTFYEDGSALAHMLIDGSRAFMVDTAVNAPLFQTLTNCASSTSPAVCGAAAAGAFVIAAAGTTVTVNTTAVTANSEIEVTPDSSLGTRLGVTCNTSLASIIGPVVTARTAGTSFAVTITGTTITNPACYSYSITN